MTTWLNAFWPENLLAFVPLWWRLAERAHLLAVFAWVRTVGLPRSRGREGAATRTIRLRRRLS